MRMGVGAWGEEVGEGGREREGAVGNEGAGTGMGASGWADGWIK